MENDAKILVVDDDSIAVFIVTKSLEKQGWTQIQSASGIKEAIKIFDWFQPDIAILDLHLGKESGHALALTLRVQKPELKIVYLSASVDPEEISEARSVPGSIYHDRSLPMEALVRILEQL